MNSVAWKADFHDAIALAEINDSTDGWYKTEECNGDLLDGSLALSAILAADSGFTVDNHVIKFFGTTKAPKLEVAKTYTAERSGEQFTPDAKNPLQVGDVLTYTITVKNAGNTDFTNLTVTDTFTGAGTPTGMKPADGEGWTPSGADKTYTWTIASLNEGSEAWTATYTYTVTEDDLGTNGTGSIKNRVTVTGTDVPEGSTDDENVPVADKQPGVEIVKTSEAPHDGDLKVGDTIDYTITVKNTGNTTLTGLTVTDTFTGAGDPTGMTPGGNGWTPGDNGKTYTWTIGSLPVGNEAWTATYTYTVVEADMGNKITNAASVAGTGVKDDTTDPNEYPVEKENPSVIVEKNIKQIMRDDEQVPDGENLQVGDKITYTITVTNDGNVNLKGLKVTDNLSGKGEERPVGENPALTWQKSDEGWTGTGIIALLPIGDKITYTYTYTVAEADLGSTITNTAIVTGEAGDEDTAEEKPTVEDKSDAVAFDKKLTQIKRGNQTISAADISNDTMLQAGDVLTYTITVQNTGNVTVNDLTISDTFNGTGDQPQGDSITWTGKAGAWTGTVDGVSLTAGDTKTYEYTYTVVDTDKGATLKNEATLRIDEEYAGSVVNENVVADPAALFEKTLTSVVRDGKELQGPISNDTVLQVGDKITYTIKVTNNGNVALNPKEMTIVEKTDTGLTFKTDNFSPFVLVWDTTTSTGGGDNSSNDNNNSNTNNTNDQTTTVNVTNEAPAPAAPTAATVPQTSDDMPVGALTAAAAAAAAALVVLLVVRKRRHGKD